VRPALFLPGIYRVSPRRLYVPSRMPNLFLPSVLRSLLHVSYSDAPCEACPFSSPTSVGNIDPPPLHPLPLDSSSLFLDFFSTRRRSLSLSLKLPIGRVPSSPRGRFRVKDTLHLFKVLPLPRFGGTCLSPSSIVDSGPDWESVLLPPHSLLCGRRNSPPSVLIPLPPTFLNAL